MITDMPQHQPEYVVHASGGSAGSAIAKAAELPPLPRCEEHPRRELDLYCKLCQTAICSTCKEAEHSLCQKKWDDKAVKGGLAHSIVFEGVERAARGLKEEVLKSLCNESSQKEQALRHAAMAVAKRRTEIETQLGVRKKEVETIEQALIKAVTERCNELRLTLKAAAAEKSVALEKQGAGLEKGAQSLQGAREGAEKTLSSLVVEERPIEVVAACLKLKQELAAMNKASQASAPVREANLHAVFTTFNLLTGGVRQMGWSGALDVDATKCTLSKRGDQLVVGAGESLEIILTTRDKLGQQLKAGGLDVKAVVGPEGSVDGRLAVKDIGDGTYVISFKAKKQDRGNIVAEALSLSVEVCGSAIRGGPFAMASFPSNIVTTHADIKALRGFAPGKSLELCYRASRDGWNAADFHRLCDGKGPTVVLAKEEANGYIFGGYTAVAWSSSDTQYNDPQAFLSSIRNPPAVGVSQMPFKGGADGYTALQHSASWGPRFGNNGDLILLVKKHPRHGTSNLGYSYKAPVDKLQRTTFLAGAPEFQLAEMEVFLVK